MKKILAVLLCFIFVGTGNVFAQGGGLSEHSWVLGAEASMITYKEPGVMEEDGNMYGVTGSYSYHNIFNRIMLKTEGKVSRGEVDYKNSGRMDNIDNYMLEFRGLAGYDFPILENRTIASYFSEGVTITPYAGIGYRYLNDDMSSRTTTTGSWGYEREISYLYSPIGIEAIALLEDGWFVGLRAEYDYFWSGTVKSNMGYLAGFYDIENDQDKGFGVRGSIIFQKKSETVDFVLAPFISYWKIQESNTTTDPGGTSWIEPKNNSKEIGCKLALRF